MPHPWGTVDHSVGHSGSKINNTLDFIFKIYYYSNKPNIYVYNINIQYTHAMAN